ncbi:MAG: hypothetical protein HZC55_10710 [Verrucomicrobia bacterium]|nr:hypothetical protein [Verrucomicrobiota bacterium]
MKLRAWWVILLAAVPAGAADRAPEPETLQFKTRALEALVAAVPGILRTYHPETGRFGRKPFVVGDQNHVFPLAVAYATPGSKNRYHRDPALLAVIMAAGDALIEVQDPQGRWRFDKKDGSYWGQTYMPWTYSRWIRAFELIRQDMPADRRIRWERGLAKGFAGISGSGLKTVHNIPAHHAMALDLAGRVLGRPEWRQQAAAFMHRVVAAQKEGGYWSENAGPVVRYGYVYVDALGVYYAATGDAQVLPALRRAAEFHRRFTYPDGSDVETIDERNPYHAGMGEGAGNVGFTFTPEGRSYLAAQWSRGGGTLKPDAAASFLQYGVEGAVATTADEGVFALVEGGEARAATLRRGAWFGVLSAYTAEIPESRWIQDRQNFVSLWRQGPGLLAGGGNTKLQPGWSTFTLGAMEGLRHRAGDENPAFRPEGGLRHVPQAATLRAEEAPSLVLRYGPAVATVRLRLVDDRRAEIEYAVKAADLRPVFAHLPLLPALGAGLQTAGGFHGELGREALALDAARVGSWVEFRGVRYQVPAGTTLHWPVLPHNPYRKDGRAEPEEGRVELRIPVEPDRGPVTVVVEARPE